MNEIYAESNYELIGRMGSNLKRYRIKANLTQGELAVNSGVGIGTIKNFESGKTHNITLDNLMRLMRAIGVLEQLEGVLPEPPISPYELEEINKLLSKQRRQRVKHKKAKT